MAPSTAEFYTPWREYNGPKCALSGFAKKSDSFAKKSGKYAEKSGNFAGKSGILTEVTRNWSRGWALRRAGTRTDMW